MVREYGYEYDAVLDKELYEKYGISDEEIAFIDSMIKPMDGGDE